MREKFTAKVKRKAVKSPGARNEVGNKATEVRRGAVPPQLGNGDQGIACGTSGGREGPLRVRLSGQGSSWVSLEPFCDQRTSGQEAGKRPEYCAQGSTVRSQNPRPRTPLGVESKPIASVYCRAHLRNEELKPSRFRQPVTASET